MSLNDTFTPFAEARYLQLQSQIYVFGVTALGGQTDRGGAVRSGTAAHWAAKTRTQTNTRLFVLLLCSLELIFHPFVRLYSNLVCQPFHPSEALWSGLLEHYVLLGVSVHVRTCVSNSRVRPTQKLHFLLTFTYL